VCFLTFARSFGKKRGVAEAGILLWSKNAFLSCLCAQLHIAELFSAGRSIRPRLIALLKNCGCSKLSLGSSKDVLLSSPSPEVAAIDPNELLKVIQMA
jgi:hypothetical protein